MVRCVWMHCIEGRWAESSLLRLYIILHSNCSLQIRKSILLFSTNLSDSRITLNRRSIDAW